MSDIPASEGADRIDNKFLTRALAAFAIAAIAKLDDDVIAAQSVVDEYGDDGIDGFYYDRTEHVAYLVQSKWMKDGTGSPDVGSVLKFVQGVNHFLSEKIPSFGPKLRAKAADISDVLSDSQATFVLMIVYTGRQTLSPDAIAPLTQLVNDLNDDAEFVTLQVLKQKELRDIVEAGAMGASVDLTVMLHEFGKVSEPYVAYYGYVEAADLATWEKYGDKLYHKNIRGFKGSTAVNDAIVATIKDNPDRFLYFNNGITLLCTELIKRPLGGVTRGNGVFECKGASVINGAQTVGSILTALSTPSAGANIGMNARVMVRLISLEDCPPEFASEVTRAANTQNRIEERDFAALDPEQHRIRMDMLLSLTKEYVFRGGDRAPAPDKGCTIDEATVALACANPDVTHAVNAKQAVGRFYKDITKPPYTILFNHSLTANKLWRSVEMMRAVDDFLKQEQKKLEGKDKHCAVHGNRVILYLVFRQLGNSVFDSEDIKPYVNRVPELIPSYLEKMSAYIANHYSSSYVGNVFKNITKCKEIIGAIS